MFISPCLSVFFSSVCGVSIPSAGSSAICNVLESYLVPCLHGCRLSGLVSCCNVSEAHGAAHAARIAWDTHQTMQPGNPGYVQLVQLGLAHQTTSDKETVFTNNVIRLHLCMMTQPCRIHDVPLRRGAASQYIIPIRDVAAEILKKFPQKLLFGNCEGDSPQVGDTLKQFWRSFRAIRPGHPVFQDHADELHRVIPCRLHMDEGTSHRKHAVMQVSWGPILKDGAASVNHCFYFTSILGDSYKEDHCGYAAGNSILDAISRHLAIHCKQAYYTGMELGSERFYLAWIGLEGDLPAQARVLHLVRHFTCAPNKCCPWCLADDRDTPYADFRPTARWKRTVGVQQPWTTPSPLLSIPGADTAEFALTDIFHLCHLGIVRTGVTSLICYLCYKGFFDQGGLNVPARLHYGYKLFAEFCRLVLQETPHLKDFTKDNLGWGSLKCMPESSMHLVLGLGYVLFN